MLVVLDVAVVPVGAAVVPVVLVPVVPVVLLVLLVDDIVELVSDGAGATPLVVDE